MTTAPIARTSLRVGFWSSLSVTLIGVAYVLTGVVWLVAGGARTAAPFEPGEPYRAILEWLILLSAPPIVVVAAALHAYAPAERKSLTLAGLALMSAFVTLTCAVHFVQLAVVRRVTVESAPQIAWLQMYPWPSLSLALDFLAWDFFLGVALLFSSAAMSRERLGRAAARGMQITAALCLIGFLGPSSNIMRFQFAAIAGYAFALPIVCAMLAVMFHRAARAPYHSQD